MKEADVEARLDPARGPPPCSPAHLRAERRAEWGSHAGAPAVAGASVPGVDGAVRASGGRPPRLGEAAVKKVWPKGAAGVFGNGQHRKARGEAVLISGLHQQTVQLSER